MLLTLITLLNVKCSKTIVHQNQYLIPFIDSVYPPVGIEGQNHNILILGYNFDEKVKVSFSNYVSVTNINVINSRKIECSIRVRNGTLKAKDTLMVDFIVRNYKYESNVQHFYILSDSVILTKLIDYHDGNKYWTGEYVKSEAKLKEFIDSSTYQKILDGPNNSNYKMSYLAPGGTGLKQTLAPPPDISINESEIDSLSRGTQPFALYTKYWLGLDFFGRIEKRDKPKLTLSSGKYSLDCFKKQIVYTLETSYQFDLVLPKYDDENRCETYEKEIVGKIIRNKRRFERISILGWISERNKEYRLYFWGYGGQRRRKNDYDSEVDLPADQLNYFLDKIVSDINYKKCLIK